MALLEEGIVQLPFKKVTLDLAILDNYGLISNLPFWGKIDGR